MNFLKSWFYNHEKKMLEKEKTEIRLFFQEVWNFRTGSYVTFCVNRLRGSKIFTAFGKKKMSKETN